MKRIMYRLWPYLLMLIITAHFISIAQGVDTPTSSPDALHEKEDYRAEISLRKQLIAEYSTQQSDSIYYQRSRIYIAQSYLTVDADSSLMYMHLAKASLDSVKHYKPVDKALVMLAYGTALINTSNIDSAKSLLGENLAYIKQQVPPSPFTATLIAKQFYEMAQISHIEQNYGEALQYLEQGIDEINRSDKYYSKFTADIYKMMGVVASYMHNLNAEFEYQNKAIEIYERLDLPDKFLLFHQYSLSYSTHKYYGDREGASQLLNKILQYYEKYKDTPSFINYSYDLQPNLNPVKNIYYYVQLQEANINKDTVTARRLLALFEKEVLPSAGTKLNIDESIAVTSFYFETGSIYHQLKNYNSAKQFYLKAKSVAAAQQVTFLQLQSCLILSTLSVDAKAWDDAIKYAEEAMAMPEFESFNQDITIEHNLGYAYYGKSNYDKAIPYLLHVLNYYKDASTNISSNYAVQNLMEVGRMFEDMHERLDDKMLQTAAFDAFYQASKMFSNLYRGGEVNYRLAAYQQQVNRGLLDHAVGHPSRYELALAQVENTQSDYLWNNFIQNQLNNPHFATPLQYQAQIDSLQQEIDALSESINDSASASEDREQANAAISSKEKILRQYQTKLISQYPKFVDFTKPTFDVASLQQHMETQDVILRYVVTDTGVYTFKITSDNLELYKLAIPSDSLSVLVTTTIHDIKSRKFDGQNTNLFAILIQPVQLPDSASVVIVADDFLSYLPFEVLTNAFGNTLLEKYSISYARSLKLLETQRLSPANATNQLVAYAPTYESHNIAMDNALVQELVREGMYELKGAAAEAKAISQLFDGALITSNFATKDKFKKTAGEYNMLHLAMHAIMRQDSSQQSGLIFSNNELMLVEEIYHLQLPAEMAVLSACNTGSGELKNGEGVQSISRAFTYAGVRSTVMSLWQVPDIASSKIMVQFYTYLKQGMRKHDALRKAKIDYIAAAPTAELRHPYYWAGFVISGDTSPVNLLSSTTKYYFIGAAILGLVLFTLFLLRKKPKTVKQSQA